MLLVLPATLQAQVVAGTLDWNSVDWTDNTGPVYAQTFTNVDGTGVDITISIDTSATTMVQAVDDNTFNTGGLAGQESLLLFMDATARNLYIDVSISFSEAVRDVQFSLFDVDQGTLTGNSIFGSLEATFIDHIDNVQAQLNAGTPFNPSITTSANNTLGNQANDVRGTDGTGSSSSAANVDFAFGQDLTSITFRYGTPAFFEFFFAGRYTPGDPDQQAISLSDISFVVPEASQIILGVLLGLLGLGHGWSIWRRKRTAVDSQPPED